METLADRIKEEMRRCGFTQQQLADKAKMAQASINKLTSGKAKESRKMPRIAAALGVNTDWLATGKGPKHSSPIESNGMRIESNATYLGGFDLWGDNTPLSDDEVALPFLREVELAAGSGKYEVIDNNGFKLRFAKSTLRKSNVQADNAVCVTASGNSMEPVIPSGTTLGVDMGCTAIKDGDIYAIEHDGHLRVKMLYQVPGGVLRLRSFNSDEWPDEHYSGDARNSIRVIGRVFWWSVLR
ncbi:MAG: XRE family transcriptional regulator [Methylococcaceae bacterium]